MSNQANIIRLLRAIANGADAKSSSRDIVFDAAADEIERLQTIIEELMAADRDHLAAKLGMERRLTDEIERLRYLNETAVDSLSELNRQLAEAKAGRT